MKIFTRCLKKTVPILLVVVIMMTFTITTSAVFANDCVVHNHDENCGHDVTAEMKYMEYAHAIISGIKDMALTAPLYIGENVDAQISLACMHNGGVQAVEDRTEYFGPDENFCKSQITYFYYYCVLCGEQVAFNFVFSGSNHQFETHLGYTRCRVCGWSLIGPQSIVGEY